MNTQKEPEIQKLNQLNKNQLSDLLFADDELKFLNSILVKYFPALMQDAKLNRIQFISNELKQLGMVRSNVVKDILVHQQNLDSEITGSSQKSVDFLKLESSRIQDEITDIHKCFKNIKREIFTLYKNLHHTSEKNAATDLVE